MIRAHVQLDETTYRLVRQKAFDNGVSFAALVRDALEHYLARDEGKLLTIEDLGFVGIGSSDQGNLSPVSERRDEALAEAFPD